VPFETAVLFRLTRYFIWYCRHLPCFVFYSLCSFDLLSFDLSVFFSARLRQCNRQLQSAVAGLGSQDLS